MIEIVFTESACGSLKIAQSYGKGEYHGGCIGVMIHHSDGREPTQEEIDAEIKKAEAQEREKWEQAIPMGGTARDVYGLPLGLSFGDIRDPLSVEERLKAMRVLYSFWDADLETQSREQLTEAAEALETIKERVAAGEDARIWYSDTPDELCGFYWLMDQLRNLPKDHGRLYTIKQLKFEEIGEEIRMNNGWGGIEPGQFHRYLPLAAEISDFQCRYFGNAWRELQQENSLIRACINGRLSSAPEDLFDFYIQREIDAQPDEFREAKVVGGILGKYEPGIGDGYIHYRIDKLVQNGTLTALTAPGEGEPGYWRTLKKVKP